MMKPLTILCLSVAICAAPAIAQSPSPSPSPGLPTWQDEIAKGHLPYHQLTVEDFPVNNKAHADSVYWIKTFIDPEYRFYLKPYNGWVYAYVTDWVVYSGFDKSESSRKSSFHEMKAELPYVQAALDISEIHARELAALKTGELPEGRGASFKEAQIELNASIEALCHKKYREIELETDALAKATNNGQNKKKTLEMAAAIKKRLAAASSSSPVLSEAKPPPVAPSPTPAASAIRKK
jgi:hypothetical protein